VTHNRYLLNHCFNKILHLEDADIQEFEGTFVEYNFALLAKKIELQEVVSEQQEEIERTRKVVERMRVEATRMAVASKGRALHAKVSYLERLEARKIKEPFVQLRQPEIALPMVQKYGAAEIIAEDIIEEITEEISEETAVSPAETVSQEEEPADILTVDQYSLSFEDTLLENVSFAIKEKEKAGRG
ncbi:MAG: hypothetical protein IIW91_06965, partial [Alistipes sp.]|nr:hypothetical protein [Alistipes sp.]